MQPYRFSSCDMVFVAMGISVALDLLDDIINVARVRRFNKKDTDDDDDDKEIKEDVDSPSSSYGKSFRRSNVDKERCSSSPTTPTSVLLEFPNNKSAKACSKVTYSPPVLLGYICYT